MISGDKEDADAVLDIIQCIGPVPALIFIAGILIIQRYPLDEQTYNAILAEIQ